jgi:hypothetical protein
LSVFGHAHGVTFALEEMRHELSHSQFVVNDQKIRHKTLFGSD